MAAGLPDPGIHEQGGIEPDHREARRRTGRHLELVVPGDHVVPPGLLDIALEQDAQWSVVPGTVEPTVYFAGREDESAPLGQRYQLFHEVHRCLPRRRCK
ncbi:hypothetical protein D3C83_58480 [compost metagenome]